MHLNNYSSGSVGYKVTYWPYEVFYFEQTVIEQALAMVGLPLKTSSD